MRSKVVKILKRAAVLLAVVAMTLMAVRIYDTQRRPPLELWHTYAPPELSAQDIDKADWNQYLAAEQAAFEAVHREVDEKLTPEERVPVNRYFEGSPVYPARFAQDWNRSYVLEPEGTPVGAVVLLHGLTDSPYSLRHIARRYRAHGFVAIAIRLPGHGTVPAASPTSSGRTGWPPRGWRCGRPAGGSGRRGRCTWSASPMAARWR